MLFFDFNKSDKYTMRYYELIQEGDIEDFIDSQESKNSKDAERLEKIYKGIALIKRDCQPYLSQVTDPLNLRRGVSRDYTNDSQGRPLINKKKAHLTGRTPRGENMQDYLPVGDKVYSMHEVVNQFFTEEFGFPFRNGIMCTGDQIQSSGFGIDVAVFPVGNFKFLWSPDIKDMNHSITKWDAEPYSERAIDRIKAADWQTTDIEAAIASKNEIMIWAKEYYTIDTSYVDRMLAKSLLK